MLDSAFPAQLGAVPSRPASCALCLHRAHARRHHHPNLARKVDVIYALSQAWCNSNDEGRGCLFLGCVHDSLPCCLHGWHSQSMLAWCSSNDEGWAGRVCSREVCARHVNTSSCCLHGWRPCSSRVRLACHSPAQPPPHVLGHGYGPLSTYTLVRKAVCASYVMLRCVVCQTQRSITTAQHSHHCMNWDMGMSRRVHSLTYL